MQLPAKPRRQQRDGMTETALSVPTPRAASTWPMKVASEVRSATGSPLAANMSLSKSPSFCVVVVVTILSAIERWC